MLRLPPGSPSSPMRGAGEDQLGAALAGLERGSARLAVGSAELAAIAVAAQRGDAGIGAHHNICACTAVAAVGTALGDELLPPEADRAASPVARGDLEGDLVEEEAQAVAASLIAASASRTAGRARTLARVRSWPVWSKATVPLHSA